jgi:hypothetical protein
LRLRERGSDSTSGVEQKAKGEKHMQHRIGEDAAKARDHTRSPSDNLDGQKTRMQRTRKKIS